MSWLYPEQYQEKEKQFVVFNEVRLFVPVLYFLNKPKVFQNLNFFFFNNEKNIN